MGKHDNHSIVTELARKENNKLCVGSEGWVIMFCCWRGSAVTTASDVPRVGGGVKRIIWATQREAALEKRDSNGLWKLSG